MNLYCFFLLLNIYNVKSVERRDNSIGSTLLRYVLTKTKYNNSKSQYGRITQAPLIKVHLHKTLLPSSFHESQKRPLNEVRLERAADMENENRELNEAYENADTLVHDLDSLKDVPLPLFNAHNYTEEEYKKLYGDT
ncbi:hypothetical protein BdWA1_000451 [Babesia duncani]|uniref:Uncharacterized protein n=1 Tax=Babesia duncani TaxID=323732 RepID=A0AAD9PMU1_9APIC|nr:hypothetical protein BdWA1_000451 [Babesia duncani]